MKHTEMSLILMTLFAPVLFSCGQIDEYPIFEDMPFALVTADDGMSATISADIDNSERTISFLFVNTVLLDEVTVEFQLNPGYRMVAPADEVCTMDLSSPAEVTVRSEAYGEMTYSISATADIPLTGAEMTFRGGTVEAEVDHSGKTVTFRIEGIHTSEYPSILLADAVPVFKLSEGYTADEVRDSWDLVSGEELTVRKGSAVYTYTVKAEIDYEPVEDYLSDFDIHKGVNLSYWMVVDGDDREWLGYVTPEQFPLWKELGFDHFRVPVSEDVLFNEDGSFHTLAVDKLHELFSWCSQNGFRAILDMHELMPREGTDSYREEDLYDPAYADFRSHFVEMWGRIAEEFSRHDNRYVAYELLNEPHDGTDDASAWSSLQDELLSAIRSHDPERVVFIPSMGWQDYNYIKFASVNAEDDPNVMVSFHYYLPMLFSHYRMLAWQDYQGSIQYPGLVIPSQQDADTWPQYAYFHQITYNAGRIAGEMSAAAEAGANVGLRVHCGEFGCSKNVPEDMRMAWFTDMISAMESAGIPWTLWESLGGGFGFVDEDGHGGNRINCELLEILTGKRLSQEEADAILEKYGLRTWE